MLPKVELDYVRGVLRIALAQPAGKLRSYEPRSGELHRLSLGRGTVYAVLDESRQVVELEVLLDRR